jgi:hypothetical protein
VRQYPGITPAELRKLLIVRGYLGGKGPTEQTLEALLNHQPVRLPSLEEAIRRLFPSYTVAWREKLHAEQAYWLIRQEAGRSLSAHKTTPVISKAEQLLKGDLSKLPDDLLLELRNALDSELQSRHTNPDQ